MSIICNLSQEEKEKIIRLRQKGLTINQICVLTGRSKSAVSEVAYDVLAPRAHWYTGERRHIYMWLVKYWRWKPPEEQHNLSMTYRIRKRRKPTNFSTPYSYPRLWEQERKGL